MKIALAQMSMTNSMEDNYLKCLKFIKEASLRNADMILFPEVQLTPFFPQYEHLNKDDYALTLDHPYIQGILNACNTYSIYAACNFYIKDQHYYDMSLLIDDKGEIIGIQKMVHIAQCRNFYEQDYYYPSEEGFHVYDTKFGKIGMVVCFDRHYPESVRTEALKGAELILIPTANTTSEPSDIFQYEIKVQSFQNSVNIAMCNRVGIENHMTFSGESIVSDYNGETLVLGTNKEELLITEVNLINASKTRRDKLYTSLRRKDYIHH